LADSVAQVCIDEGRYRVHLPFAIIAKGADE